MDFTLIKHFFLYFLSRFTTFFSFVFEDARAKKSNYHTTEKGASMDLETESREDKGNAFTDDDYENENEERRGWKRNRDDVFFFPPILELLCPWLFSSSFFEDEDSLFELHFFTSLSFFFFQIYFLLLLPQLKEQIIRQM